PHRMSSRLVSAASRHGLLLTPGPRFFTHAGTAGERHLRLPYNQSHEVLTEAVARLRLAYDEVLAPGEAATTPRTTGTLEMIA
ncbi:MAG: hypothetical protein ABW075_02540, partial [Aeromicrobium sp.]